MKKSLIVLALLPILHGCAPTLEAPTYDQPKVTFNTPEDTVYGLENWEVSCSYGSNCNEAVGQLVVRTGATEISMCTAFLVAENTVVTNSHCAESMSRMEDLSTKAEIVFPSSDSRKQEVRRVLRLVDKTEKTVNTDPDLAILTIKESQTSRTPLRFDTSGVADQEMLTAYKINPSGRRDGNTLVPAKCRVVTRPFYLQEFTQPNDPTIAFGDCEIVHGNSGSPLVGSTGGVKAVVFATLGKDQSTSLYDRYLQQNKTSVLDHSDLYNKHMNLGTNVSCLNTNAPISIANCNVGKIEDRLTEAKTAQKTQLEDAAKKAIVKIGAWAAQNAKILVWAPDVQKTDDAILVVVKPFCVQPVKTWIGDYSKKGWVLTSYDESANLDFSDAPYFRLNMRYDDSFRPYFEPNETTEPVSVSFVPKDLKSDKGGVMKVDHALYRPQASSLSEILNGATDSDAVKPCGKVFSPSDIQGLYKN